MGYIYHGGKNRIRRKENIVGGNERMETRLRLATIPGRGETSP